MDTLTRTDTLLTRTLERLTCPCCGDYLSTATLAAARERVARDWTTHYRANPGSIRPAFACSALCAESFAR